MIQAGRTALVAGVAALSVVAAGAASPARRPGDARPLLQRIEASEPHMGTLVRVALYAGSVAEGDAAARAAFDRLAALDARLSDYRDDSEVSAVTRAAAGTPIAISAELFTLLETSDALARRTGGAFDVTAGRLTHLWRRARRVNARPSAADVDAARVTGGHARVHLERARRTVTLAGPGIELDLGAIAKGYAADEALGVLRARGIRAALVAIGGDIAAGDPPPGRASWMVAVPRLDAFGQARTSEPYWIALAHAAVSTSGDAEQWMTADGVRYSHVVDPRTGWPLTGRRSTSVVARCGIDADALSTAIGILDDAAGAALIRDWRSDGQAPAALWQRVADGAVTDHHTSTWPAIAGPAPVVTP